MTQLALSLDDAGAVFSPCRRYRYSLFRRWAEGPQCCFVMLNPSTADELKDDPTIRRCIGFAKSWSCGSLVVGNIFAYRSTDPDELYRQEDPVGPENDRWLQFMQTESPLVIAAWGNHGTHQGRGDAVRALVPGLYVLGLTKTGQPKHPLYVAGVTKPVPWEEKSE